MLEMWQQKFMESDDKYQDCVEELIFIALINRMSRLLPKINGIFSCILLCLMEGTVLWRLHAVTVTINETKTMQISSIIRLVSPLPHTDSSDFSKRLEVHQLNP